MPGPTPLTAMEGLSSAQEDAASACKRWLEQAQRAAEAVKESYADVCMGVHAHERSRQPVH